MQELLPEQDFLYLWDTAYMPYGEKDSEFLRSRSFTCLHRMFDHWCKLIVIACNTSSAYAIRTWQQQFSEKKVLSITVPGVEELIASWSTRPLLLATQATIASNIYQDVLDRLFPEANITISGIACTWLATAIEEWVSESEILTRLSELRALNKDLNYDSIILWCTHYPIIASEIWLIFGDVPIVNPSLHAAHKLRAYVDSHPELWIQLNKKTSPINRFFVTGDVKYNIWEEKVSISSSIS